MKSKIDDRLKKEAMAAGIDLIGITSAEPFVIRDEKERVVDPEEILKGARSVIIAGFCIYNELDILPSEPDRPRGRFSSYGLRVYLPMRAYCEKVIKQFLRQEGFNAVSSMKIPAKLTAVRGRVG